MATPPTFSAGSVLTAAQMNAVGLWEIKADTIGSAVATVTVSNAFSADYDAYRVIITGGSSTTNNYIKLTLGSTATGYYAGYSGVTFATGAAALGADNNGTSWTASGYAQTTTLQMNVDIINPFLSKITSCTSFYNQTVTTGGCGVMHGWLNNTTSFTTFTITPNTGTWTGGTVRVYGYRN